MDRRKFLKVTCALSALGITGTLIESCKKNNTPTSTSQTPPGPIGVKTPQGPTVNFTIDLTKPSNASLNTAGGSLSSNGVVVVYTGSSYLAIAQTCTHNGCSIGYNQAGNNFVCPCHNGVYDTHGNVVSGPPPEPLKTYSVTKNGSILTVSG